METLLEIFRQKVICFSAEVGAVAMEILRVFIGLCFLTPFFGSQSVTRSEKVWEYTEV